jgi:hypothetical protein
MQTLNERLTAARVERDGKRDPALTAVIHRATAELVASDILEGVPKAGDRAPSFARPDAAGETHRLRSMVKRGPVIVSFFRGRW